MNPISNSIKLHETKHSSWKETFVNRRVEFECIKGALVDSVFWIENKAENSFKYGQCQIIISGDLPKLRKKIIDDIHRNQTYLSNDYNCEKGENAKLDFKFSFQRNDINKEKVQGYINLIDKKAPLGKDALSTISKLLLGYSKEEIRPTSFLPLLVFFMGMKSGGAIPSELLTCICKLSIESVIENTDLEFDIYNSEKYRRDFITAALQPDLDIQNTISSEKKSLKKRFFHLF